MIRLLSNQASRQFNIIERLANQANGIYVTQLAEENQCSSRTILEDLTALQAFSHIFCLEVKQQVASLRFHPAANIKATLVYFFQHSVSFKLLEYLFFNDSASIEELTERLFISRSTLYRTGKKIDAIISEKFNIHLNQNPFQIVGEEADIRKFFFHYFDEAYSEYDWPFKHEIKEKEFETFLQFYIQHSNHLMDFSNFRLIKRTAAINLIRLKQGYFAVVYANYQELYAYVTSLPSYQSFIGPFSEWMEMTFDYALVENIFFLVTNSSYLFTFEQFEALSKEDLVAKHSFELLDQMLPRLAHVLKLPLINQEELMLTIHNTAHLDGFEPGSIFLLYHHRQRFNESIQQQYPRLYREFYQELGFYLRQLEIGETSTLLDHLIFTTFVHWQDLYPALSRQKRKVRILTISSLDYSHSLLMRDSLRWYFGDRVDISDYPEKDFNPTIAEQLDCDIIVTNFTMPALKSKQCFNISSLPLQEELSQLEELVLDTQKQFQEKF